MHTDLRFMMRHSVKRNREYGRVAVHLSPPAISFLSSRINARVIMQCPINSADGNFTNSREFFAKDLHNFSPFETPSAAMRTRRARLTSPCTLMHI